MIAMTKAIMDVRLEDVDKTGAKMIAILRGSVGVSADEISPDRAREISIESMAAVTTNRTAPNTAAITDQATPIGTVNEKARTTLTKRTSIAGLQADLATRVELTEKSSTIDRASM
jgi:hypothetical protein